MEHLVYLGLGSNLGNRAELMEEAIEMIDQEVGTVVRQSAIIETEPWGMVSENRFLNACIAVETELTPQRLLRVTQDIEKRLGRAVKSTDDVFHDRVIDIDILLYDRIKLNKPNLVIPHRNMWKRDFVMVPLREICADIDDIMDELADS